MLDIMIFQSEVVASDRALTSMSSLQIMRILEDFLPRLEPRPLEQYLELILRAGKLVCPRPFLR